MSKKLWNFIQSLTKYLINILTPFLLLSHLFYPVFSVSFVPCFAICLAHFFVSDRSPRRAYCLLSPSACFLSWHLFCLVSCPGFYWWIFEILDGKTLIQIVQIKICKCEAFRFCVQQSLWKLTTLITAGQKLARDQASYLFVQILIPKRTTFFLFSFYELILMSFSSFIEAHV